MRLLLSALLIAASGLAQAASIPMYDLPLKSGPAGAVYKMSERPNSVFVFEAYKLSCVYCNKNAPNVDRLADDYRDNPRVEVLDLGLDTSNDAYAEWIRRHKPNHPVVQDVGNKIFNALKSQNSIPQVFIVNCRGQLVGSTVGEWNAAANKAVRDYVDQALTTVCE